MGQGTLTASATTDPPQAPGAPGFPLQRTGPAPAARPPVPELAPGSWGLAYEDVRDLQGLVVSAFQHLTEATALFLRFGRKGGGWLSDLLDAGLITDGTGKTTPCGAVAITWTGLGEIGLEDEVLKTFSPPFREGMTDFDRQRRLGDSKPEMVIKGGMRWSGNVAWDRRSTDNKDEPEPVRTPETVHALLLLYAEDQAAVAMLRDKVMALVAPHDVTLAFELPLTLKPGAAGLDDPPREHFGFADGLSQPLPHLDKDSRHALHGVPVGEVLIGYPNAHRELAPGPVVTGATELRHEGAATGLGSLGKNGSYLTVRQLHQDVAAFWASMNRAAQAVGEPDLSAAEFAEKVVGRKQNGDMLLPGGSLPAVAGQPDNDFGFFAKDRYGMGCPVGSHVRRANPRDGLAPKDSARDDMRDAANNHRILRRGRKYGLPLPEGASDDGIERGLLFMALHTDIARQFEFIQQTWLLNPVFGTLVNETDPLLGLAGPFTLPTDPLRRIAQVETFVTLVGGEYFFLPSMSALRYLGQMS